VPEPDVDVDPEVGVDAWLCCRNVWQAVAVDAMDGAAPPADSAISIRKAVELYLPPGDVDPVAELVLEPVPVAG